MPRKNLGLPLIAARIDPDKVGAFLRENNARILQDAIDELLLVQRAAERWTDARDWPAAIRKGREPSEQRFVLAQRDVIQERVASVQIARHAAGRDVAHDILGGVEVQRPARS